MSVHLYDLLNNQHFDVRFLWVFPVFLNDFNRYHDHFMAEEQEEFCLFFCSFNTFFFAKSGDKTQKHLVFLQF